MRYHPPLKILVVHDGLEPRLQRLLDYFTTIAHLDYQAHTRAPENLTSWDAVLTPADGLKAADEDRLTAFVGAGGGWLHFAGPTTRKVPALFGAQLEPAGPHGELRVLFSRQDHPLGKRLPDAIYVQNRFHPFTLQSNNAETMLYTDWHFQHRAVWVTATHGKGKAACTTLNDFNHPVLCQIIYRQLRQLAGDPIPESPLGVGILGYAPSVGAYHGQGVLETEGMALKAVCDLNPERVQQARQDYRDIRTYPSAKAMCEDPDVDLVIIATPPNTHSDLSLLAMTAGKHVVCEKPLALTRDETSAMVNASMKQGVHLSCHQNRRWDVDYLAIKHALEQGEIGDLFHMETFVGGFSHPCGYWHSDAKISGGMTYDWGAHYIDWMVGLCSDRIDAVIGTRHKRVWHDVTNADQERIQVRFESGMEAEFIHSDIAAVRKPKWYLLGTRGAIVGHWQDVTAYQIDPIHYFHPHAIPATEMPPELILSKHQGEGKLSSQKLALPDRPVFGFHRNLADHLLIGEPLMAPLSDSLRVVAVLEAAARSMDNGGRVEVVHV